MKMNGLRKKNIGDKRQKPGAAVSSRMAILLILVALIIGVSLAGCGDGWRGDYPGDRCLV